MNITIHQIDHRIDIDNLKEPFISKQSIIFRKYVLFHETIQFKMTWIINVIGKKGIYIVISLACFLSPLHVFAQTSEYTIKAAFLERFTRFIEWPEESTVSDTTKDFVLGIIGENPFGSILEELYDTQKIKNKRVEILHVSNLNEITGCHLLFISKSEEKELSNILLATKNKPILTISDTNGFAEKGVLINFYLAESKIRFEINEKAVNNSGLSISYHLFNVAKIIKPVENNR